MIPATNSQNSQGIHRFAPLFALKELSIKIMNAIKTQFLAIKAHFSIPETKKPLDQPRTIFWEKITANGEAWIKNPVPVEPPVVPVEPRNLANLQSEKQIVPDKLSVPTSYNSVFYRRFNPGYFP